MKAGLGPNICVVVIALICAIGLWGCYDHLNIYWQGVASSAAGVAFEMLLLVIVLGFYEHRREKQTLIDNLMRRIDDFKGLDDDYGHAVMASSIRELAARNITKIDFRGCRLSKFSFDSNGIKSIKGSIFDDGFWVDETRKNFGYVREVDFSSIDCSDVKFSMGNLFPVYYENCNFWWADLRNASFTGASLKWDSEKVIADKSQWHDEEGAQIYLPAFDADLDQANFDECSFMYADFRGAKNILNASFIEAKGLDTCFFDEGIKENLKAR